MEPIQEKTNIFQDITVKSAAKYALLPGVLPRLGRLAGAISKFLFMFTTLFGAVGLIDKNHPCLRAENIGRYRFVDIVGLAASRVIFDRKHLPQTLMFFAVVGSIVLTVAIFMVSIVAFVFNMGSANAQYFGEADAPAGVAYKATEDWAYQFLHRIFGNSSFTGVSFWGGDAVGTSANGWYSSLFVYMLKHYSYALLVIAAFMIIYLLVITIAESAKTGQPFGTRFDSVWAPIRLALAIGLLIPVSGKGYNGAQLIAFQSAEWGSNLATNIWFKSLQNVKDEKFITVNVADPGIRFVRDIFLVNVCRFAMIKMAEENHTNGFLGFGGVDWEIADYDHITSSVDKGDYVENVGAKYEAKYCGSYTSAYQVRVPANYGKGNGESGKYLPEVIAQRYKGALSYFSPKLDHMPMQILAAKIGKNHFCCKDKKIPDLVAEMGGYKTDADLIKEWIVEYWTLAYGRNVDMMKYLSAKTDDERDAEWQPYFGNKIFEPSMNGYNAWLINSLKDDQKHGWASAGVFYLRMSNAMSNLDRVVQKPPRVSALPMPITNVKRTSNGKGSMMAIDPTVLCTVETGILGSILLGPITSYINNYCGEYKVSLEYNNIISGAAAWFDTTIKNDPNFYAALGGTALDKELALPEAQQSENSGINSILGPFQQRLYNNAKINPYMLNPLGEVIAWGSKFISIATWLYGFAIFFGFTWASGISSLASTFANILIVPGFMLAFVVPMMPFLYFMFGVVEWMISIIEAVIGMPLWALSFITLEGDALGQGMQGVKMLFEIVLRPTILILSLVVSILIFTASIKFVNDAMDAVNESYTGSIGGSLSFASSMWLGFGMVVMYMMTIYSLATSSFKLINIIPDNFGRWMGLPQGFGGQMKVGVDTVTAALAGGAVVGAMGTVAGAPAGLKNSMKGGYKGYKDKQDKKKAEHTNYASDKQAMADVDTQGGPKDMAYQQAAQRVDAYENKYGISQINNITSQGRNNLLNSNFFANRGAGSPNTTGTNQAQHNPGAQPNSSGGTQPGSNQPGAPVNPPGNTSSTGSPWVTTVSPTPNNTGSAPQTGASNTTPGSGSANNPDPNKPGGGPNKPKSPFGKDKYNRNRNRDPNNRK